MSAPPTTAGPATAPPPPAVATPPGPTVAGTPTPSPIPLPTFVQLSAPSRDVVWALVGGEALFRSTDRGETWERRTFPVAGNFAPFSFADERRGWVAELGGFGLNCATRIERVWRTADGGGTYEDLVPQGLPGGRCVGALTFTGDARGYLTEWSPGAPPAVRRSDDGGRTWAAARPLPDPPGGPVALRAGAVQAVGGVLLLATASDGPSGIVVHVYRSTDGGSAWSHLAAAPPNVDPVFVTPARWLAFTGSELVETTDAGATWHPFPSDYSQAAPVPPDALFADASVGYATARGTLRRTVDGGARWTTLRTPGT